MPPLDCAHTQRLAASCTLVLFCCLTVSGVLSDPGYTQLPRTLDLLELWSGVGAVVSAARSIKLQAQGFDKHRSAGETEESEDLCTLAGVSNAIKLLMSVVDGGLLMLAPDCSSWTFPNISRTQRQHSVSGNTEYYKVREGNTMAEVAAFMFALAVCRGVNVVMENPPRSYIWEYLKPHFSPYGFLVDVVVDRCAFDDTRGRKIGKKYMFRASGPWIQTLTAWACSCKHPHLLCMTVTNNGRLRFNGNENLKRSQVYPIKLGAAIVQAWQKGFHHAASISEAALSYGPTFAVSGVRKSDNQPDPWADLHVASGTQREGTTSGIQPAKRQKQGLIVSHATSSSRRSFSTSMDPWEDLVESAAASSNEDPWAIIEGTAGGPADPWSSIVEDCTVLDPEDAGAGF